MHELSVYLASRTEEENQLLRRKLEHLQDEFRGVRFVGLHPQGLGLSASEQMSVVVLNVLEWTRPEATYLIELRREGYEGPVLVLAKANATDALKSLRAMDGVVFLEKPFVPKDLAGIVRKMLQERAVSQRIHRRFNTDELAEIFVAGKEDVYSSRVCNLSKGGAYLEFTASAPIQAGDIVRVKVELSKVNRVYTVPARVVWTGYGNSRNLRSPGPVEADGSTPARRMTAGIEFVGTPDVKRAIARSF